MGFLSKLSLKAALSAPPLLLATGALILSIGLVFHSARQALDQTLERLEGETARNVAGRLEALMAKPFLLNETNAAALESGILTMEEGSTRDRYFARQMKAFPEVSYSFYGREDRSFFGARRDEQDAVEVIHNSLEETGGNSRYFSIDPEGNPLVRTLEVPNFDCRTRPWYKSAAASGRQIYSPVYQHFVYKDLAITAAKPIFQSEGKLTGVLGVDFRLDRINTLLASMVSLEGLEITLVERPTLQLIGNSRGLPNYTTAGGTLKRLGLQDREDPLSKSVAVILEDIAADSSASRSRKDKIFLEPEMYWVESTPFNHFGLDWLVVVSIPDRVLTSGVYQSLQTAVLLSVLLVLFLSLNAVFLVRQLVRPLMAVVHASGELAAGRWDYPMPLGTYKELEGLTGAFNTMASQLKASIEGLESTVAQRTAELEAANRTKERFLAIVAHDLRGPMGTLHQYLQELSSGSLCLDPDSTQETFTALSSTSGNLYNLLENLLAWASSQRNSLKVQQEVIDLVQVVKETLDVLAPQGRDKNIALIPPKPSRSLPPVWVDRRMVLTVCRNLVSNAVKFTQPGGRVEVLLEADADRVFLVVKDTGTGIPQDLLPHLFDPGKKTHTQGTSGEPGTGLGLLLCKEFVEKNGGSLKVRSTGPQGTEFELSLPTAAGKAE